MELEDVHSELCALRKLYGLLQSSEDGLHASSVNLDDKARLLLKKLLDCATERVFESHSKIIAAQSGVSDALCSTQHEQPGATPKLQPPASLDISKASPIVILNSSKDLNFHTITSLKDELSPTRPTHQGIVLEQSKPSISLTKAETRKKHFRVCEKSSVKQLNSARETKIFSDKTQSPNKGGNDQDQQYDDQLGHVHRVNRHVKGLEPKNNPIKSLKSIEKPRQKRIREIQCNASTARSLASSCTLVTGVVKPGGEHNLACEIDKKPEDADNISKEVAKAIKQIESRLAIVQLPVEVVDPLNEKNASHQGLFMKANSILIADPIIQTKEGVVTRSELRQAAESVLIGNVLPSQEVSHGLLKVKDSSPAYKALSQCQKPVSVGTDLPSQEASQKKGKARETNDVLSQLVSHQKGGKSKGTTLPDNVPSQVSKSVAQHELLSQKPSQLPGQNVNAIVKKLESLSRLTSQNDHVSSQTCNYVHGLRVSPSGDELVKGSLLHAKMPSQNNKENRDQNLTAQKETSRKVSPTSRLSMLPQSGGFKDFVEPSRNTQLVDPGHKLSRTRTRESTRRENNLPRQINVRPTLLDHKSSRIKVLPTFYEDLTEDRNRSGVHKNIHEGPRNKIVRPQQFSEETSSSSRASSSWTTQQASSSSSESKGLGRVAGDSSSEESNFSHGRVSQYWDLGPPRRVGPTKSYRSGPRKKPAKQIGRLRRFKNKLGLIFHHHHHHHHHHHRDKESDHSNDEVNATSLWKSLQKIFHRTNRDEVYGDRMVENLRKSVVSSVPRKNQHGHFQALVNGLMRQARHSKKSKPSKGGIGRLGNGQHGHNKKKVKKLQWWQIFQRHRGVKLPNRGRVKLGFTSKKNIN